MSLTALQGGRGLAVWGFKIALPGSTFRFGNAPYSSVSEGHFAGLVRDLSSITRAVSNRDGRLPAVQFTAKIWDHDRSLQRVLTGARAKEVRGSVASMKLLTPTVAYSAAPTFFDGQLIRWGLAEPFLIEFVCKTNDEQLARPSRQPSITRNNWPNADSAAYDLVAPVLYGHHDASTTRTGPGFVRAILVDRAIYRYLVCAGKAKAVSRVYVNGTQVSSSLYTTSYVVVQGRQYTTILFDNAADALSAGVADSSGVSVASAVVTCDAQGYETVGDGSGSVITNPASQVAHFLSNWILGGYLTGNWLSTNSLIDSALLTAEEATMTALTAGGSFYKDVRITGLDALAAYCVSFERKCFWSRNFKIGLDGEKIFTQPYLGNVIRWGTMEMKPTSITEKDFSVTSQITARQCYAAADEAYVQTLDVQDATATIEAVREFERPWSEAR